MWAERLNFPDRMLRAPEDGGGGGGSQPPAGQGQQSPGAGAEGAPASWYAPLNLDADAVRFIEDRKFGDINAVMKSAIESDRMARSRNVVEKPEKGKEREWAGWSDLGWIADPAKYALSAPEAGKLGFTYDAELFEQLRQTAHEMRVPLPALQALHDKTLEFWGKRIGDAKASGDKALADTEAALREEWGADYEGKLSLAQRAAKHLGIGADDAAELERLVKAPRLLKMFAKVGGMLGEASLIGGDGGGRANDLPATVEATEAELRRIEGDPEWMKVFTDGRDPRQKDYQAQRQRLIKHLAELKAGRRAA